MTAVETVRLLEEKIFGQRSYLHHLHMKVVMDIFVIWNDLVFIEALWKRTAANTPKSAR